jgi:hypothetical protein
VNANTFGWGGVVLAVSATVFWMLLQFSRALRAMRQAAGRPLGSTPSAVTLHAKLTAGMRLLDILPLAGSLGRQVAEDPETFVWQDEGGDTVRVELRAGRLQTWKLERAGS